MSASVTIGVLLSSIQDVIAPNCTAVLGCSQDLLPVCGRNEANVTVVFTNECILKYASCMHVLMKGYQQIDIEECVGVSYYFPPEKPDMIKYFTPAPVQQGDPNLKPLNASYPVVMGSPFKMLRVQLE